MRKLEKSEPKKMKSNKLKESADYNGNQMSFKDMLKLVVESGGQQQIDPVDEPLFNWAQRVAESKCANPREREVFAGLVYERMGGVFNMYDVLSENTLTESTSTSDLYRLDISLPDEEVHLVFDNDARVVFDFEYEFNGRETDAGFGYEYGSISGYHDATDGEGGFKVTFLDISHHQDEDDIIAVAQQLNIPAKFARHPESFVEPLLDAIGGEEELAEKLREQLDKEYWDDFVKHARNNF